MSGTYSRNRFFQLAKFDASLSSRFGGIPTYMERDDSSSQSNYYSQTTFSPHVVLPPIKYRRFGNNVNQESGLPFQLRKPQPVINSMSHHTILDNLLSTMPELNQLPDVPMNITPDQENAILLETNYQLANFDATNLRDLYVTLTNADPDLSGCISYNDLLFTFQRKQIPITEQLLQLIAAQFISRKESSKVNYEKILSFLGAALKLNKTENNVEHFASQTPRSQKHPAVEHERQRSPGRVVYYHDSSCKNDEDLANLYTEKDDPVILRLLENSIRHQFTPINLESLRLSFQRADRLLRGSLSEQQIKELCYQHDVRIDDSVIERVIHRCKQRGGGQYDWQQFIRYLERVQPVKTGLEIRASKMPSDFVKYVPHPSSSWPQAETTLIWGSPIHNHYKPPSPSFRDQNRIENQLPPPLTASRDHGVQTLQNKNNNNYYNNNENFDPLLMKLNRLQQEVNSIAERTPASEDIKSNRDEYYQNYQNINNYNNDFDPHLDLITENNDDSNYQVLPWFDRFMEMADYIYKCDFNSSGALPENLMLEITEKYNRQQNLKLKREDIRSAMQASQRSHGSIDINNYLKLLAVKN